VKSLCELKNQQNYWQKNFVDFAFKKELEILKNK